MANRHMKKNVQYHYQRNTKQYHNDAWKLEIERWWFEANPNKKKMLARPYLKGQASHDGLFL
jgi:hypothetical protein